MGQAWLFQPGLSSTSACQTRVRPLPSAIPPSVPLTVPLKAPLGSSLLLLLNAARVIPYQCQPTLASIRMGPFIYVL